MDNQQYLNIINEKKKKNIIGISILNKKKKK